MKICIFCHDSYMSGATLALYDWLSCDKKNEYLVVLPHNNKMSYFHKLNNVKVISGNYFFLVKELKKRSIKFKIKKIVKVLYQIIGGKYNRRKTKKIVERWQPNVIITNSFVLLEGAIIAKKINVPHIWHIREFMELDHQITHYNHTFVRELTKNSYAIFISKAIESYYLKKYRFLSTKVIYDQVKIESNLNYRESYFENNIIKIMIAGILQENKGQLEAIKIVELVKSKGYNVKLDIYGEGPYYDMLKKYISSRSIDYVKFMGFCQDLNSRRCMYDISLICSKNEAFGRVTVESMWAKNITIAANTGATSEIINDQETGYLYSLGDIEECCKLIIYSYNNAREMYKMTELAHSVAQSKYCQPIYTYIIEYIKNECL